MFISYIMNRIFTIQNTLINTVFCYLYGKTSSKIVTHCNNRTVTTGTSNLATLISCKSQISEVCASHLEIMLLYV